MNVRLSKKEKGLLKGAIRRVFSRSDLRRKVVMNSIIIHQDDNRPRVKKWSKCSICNKPTPTYQVEIDHIDPIVPVSIPFEHMNIDTLVNRIWCDESNLQAICKPCHIEKTKVERKLRSQYKQSKKKK